MAEMKKDFGAFELHEKIGSGGMASVYLGVQKSLDRKVVLKVLHPHLAEDEKLVARFDREARAAAMMRHPNIVQVIDCGRFGDVSYIAMEFVAGVDLKKLMEAHGSPPLEVALLLLRDLCAGMEHAHQHHIIHRDIKPANIMLTRDGQLKIMDFGLARSGADATTQMTLAGSVLGTPAYMSPEQSTGETVDERSDIFSVGVVGYELLGGQRPFQGDSYSTVLRAVLTIEPPPLEQLNPLLPPEVVRLVHRMLEKDVGKRYPTIGQALADLESIIEQMGMSRSAALLREYAADPAAVAQVLRKKRLSRHVDQGLFFENMGLGKIDDAVIEFRRALHLDPENKVAREHLRRLEKELERIRAEKEAATLPPSTDQSTMILPPEEPARRPAPARPPARTASARDEPAPRAARGGRSGTRALLVGLAVVVVAVAAIFGVSRMRGGQAPPESAPAPAEAPSVPATGVPSTPPAPTSERVARGSLDVTTLPPGAEIRFGDEVQPRLSNFTADSVPAGPLTVSAAKTGFRTASKQIRIEPGLRTQVILSLEPEATTPGTVVVRVSPYATYYVDDQEQGQPNTMTARLELVPGTHTIRAVHPSFPPHVWSDVRVGSGQTVRLSHDFLAASVGVLKVTSEGGWASVLLDGKPTGKTTPAEFPGLSAGDHVVALAREGFEVVENNRTVAVKPGGTVAIKFTIKPR